MPAFDTDLTPTRSMGVIPESFRKQRATVRSYHPELSFAAWGAKKGLITQEHSLSYGLGDNSPLGRIYDLDGWILLLGVGHDSNTSLHLAEYRANYDGKSVATRGAPVMHEDRREWREFEDIKIDEGDFKDIGEAFAKQEPSLF